MFINKKKVVKLESIKYHFGWAGVLAYVNQPSNQ